jgi:hypothetical protein
MNIEIAEQYLITEQHYEFVRRVTGFEECLITNESSLYDFNLIMDERPYEEKRKTWLDKIEREYHVRLDYVEELGIVELYSELEKLIVPDS